MRDHVRIGVGRDDQRTARRLDLVDLSGGQYGPCTDDRLVADMRGDGGDAVIGIGRVERYFDQGEASLDQRVGDGDRLGRGEAAKDGDQRAGGKGPGETLGGVGHDKCSRMA